MGKLRAKTFLIEDSRENEGSLDLLFFVLHLLIRDILRCFKTEKKKTFQGEKKEKVKRKMEKNKRYILLEKEISCWKEFSSWNPEFRV